jgi:hypothetical protein
MALISGLKDSVTSKVTQMQRNAEEWLAAKAASLKTENLPQLLLVLNSPPPFLQPESFSRLEALRLKVHAGLDTDEVQQVIAHFQRISDPQKRREIINQLQQMV